MVNAPGTDDWYVVYHRFALNGPGGPGGDGTIEPVVPTLGSVSPVRR